VAEVVYETGNDKGDRLSVSVDHDKFVSIQVSITGKPGDVSFGCTPLMAIDLAAGLSIAAAERLSKQMEEAV
jgi:hypothetical protein